MNWILVIYIYAGVLANGDSVAITSIPNFTTQQECRQAGKDAEGLVAGSAKVYRFVCLRKAQEKCNGFCGEYECKENQSICKRKAQEK